MTRDEAIHALIEIAKESVATVDGEWGCGHNYNEALTLVTEAEPELGVRSQRITDCYMHDEAVRIAALIAALTPKETEK